MLFTCRKRRKKSLLKKFLRLENCFSREMLFDESRSASSIPIRFQHQRSNLTASESPEVVCVKTFWLELFYCVLMTSPECFMLFRSKFIYCTASAAVWTQIRFPFVIVSYQKSHQSRIQPAGDTQNLFFYSATRLIMIGNLLQHRQRRGDAQIYRLFGFFHYFNI